MRDWKDLSDHVFSDFLARARPWLLSAPWNVGEYAARVSGRDGEGRFSEVLAWRDMLPVWSTRPIILWQPLNLGASHWIGVAVVVHLTRRIAFGIYSNSLPKDDAALTRLINADQVSKHALEIMFTAVRFHYQLLLVTLQN
jgi:hypothetical protein